MTSNQFLFEKFGYFVKELKNEDDIEEMKTESLFSNIRYFAYDTETTGLDFMHDKPFLVIFGFDNKVYYWDAQLKDATLAMFDIVREHKKMLFAHNAKYDYHMLLNGGTPIPDDIELSDTVTLFRLINECDDEHASMRLEKLGEKFVDPTSKFASNLIKEELHKMRKERKKMVTDNYKMLTGEKSFKDAWETYLKRVRFITDYHECFNDYKEPNYYDVYLRNRELVIKYAIDDVIIMLEFLKKAGNIYSKKYYNYKTKKVDTRIWKQENKLIPRIAIVERNGFKVDVDYLKKSHYLIEEFKTKLYDKLHTLTNDDWKVGQHEKIKQYFKEKHNLVLAKSDKKAIQELTHHEDKTISEIASLIIKLRTVDKWLSTYIDGVLNKIIEVNGEWKLFTSINNNGTISGRVSCDLQQMPKYAILETDDNSELLLDESLTDDEGHELFHPRKFVIPSDGYKLYFADYSQMELRIQAYYTILTGYTDYNLCRAYMPYDCYTLDENLEEIDFNYKNPDHIRHAYDWKWYNRDGSEWEATDLHTKTTLTAFPELKDQTETKEFKKKWRYLGKSTNFAKNYGCGAVTLASNLNVTLDIANKLSEGYNRAYPGVIKYQKATQSELLVNGYVENLLGRRYYIEKSTNYYKANNYLIQGSGADALKEVEIKIIDYLKDKKSRFILPIHDEVAIEVHPDEESYVPKQIKQFMEEVQDVIPYVPMVSEVEMTETNWASKKEINI